MRDEQEESKKSQDQHRARYTLEFKLEAVRLVKAGQEASVTARVPGMPKQTLSNWVRLAEKGELQGASDRPERRADGAGATACRAGPREDGARHPEKGDRVLREGITVKYA
jgi:transposase-like protein